MQSPPATFATAPPLDVWVSREMLFSDTDIRPCPLLMHLSEPDTDAQTRFWNPLRERLPQLVRVHYFDDIGQAGPLVVVPHDAKEWIWKKSSGELQSTIRRFLASGRTVVTFATGIEYQAQPGEIVFASSVYQTPGETNIPLPSWLYDIGQSVTPISKPAQPNITFRGNTKYSGLISNLMGALPIPDAWMHRMASDRWLNRKLALRFRFGIARLLRQRVVRHVGEADNVVSDLVELGNYFSFTEAEQVAAKASYLRSIQEHAYVLCIRGDTNGDYRTYEVLSAGRIPVIIDTKLQFPALEGMEWSDFALVVPLAELRNIGQLIEDFHDRLTDSAFRHKCRLARTAFEQLLPERYIDRIISEITMQMRQPDSRKTSRKTALPVREAVSQ